MKQADKITLQKSFSLFILVFFFSTSFSSGQIYPPLIVNIFDSSATLGYYFISPKYPKSIPNPPTGYRETQMILDRYGEVIYFHNWNTQRASDFKIQQNGLVTYMSNYQCMVMDSTFTLIDSIHPIGLKWDDHEFLILPNGHYLIMAAEKDTMDLSSYNMFLNNNTPGSKTALVRRGVIQEQDANKNVVFEWHTKDHYAFDDTDPTFLLDTVNVDWTHCNAIDLDYDGNYLLSTRRMNEITKINRSDSSVMWRLGGKNNQFTFTNDTLGFLTQHDIRRISNGNITLFDNGYRTPHHPCGAREYTLDENQMTATLAWTYTYNENYMSEYLGSVQRIANGNTMINYGNLDSSNLIFNLVSPAGLPLFEVRSPDTLNSYRGFNYPTLPWNLNRPKIICDQIGGQMYLYADSGYSKYYWSTGETVHKIAITTPGTYSVFVPRGSGGFLRSEKYIVTNVSAPCPPCPLASQPGAISGNMNPCSGSTQTYSVIPDPIATSYSWTFPPGWTGSSGTNSITVVVGTNSGTISVRANDSCGSSSAQYSSVNVTIIPAQPINIIGSLSACPYTSYTYSVTPIPGATSYTWTLPTGWVGSSATNSINVVTDNNGGTISVKSNNFCGSSLARHKVVTVSLQPPAMPRAIIVPPGGTMLCQGAVKSYSISPVNNAVSYTWTPPAGAIITSGQGTTNVTVTFGTGFIKSDYLAVTANKNNCGSSKPKKVYIHYNGPAAPGPITGAQYGVCGDPSVNYSVNGINGLTYNWSFDTINASVISGQGTAAITAGFATSYTSGKLNVTAGNGCGISNKRTVLINAVPKIPGTITGPTTVCLNQQGVPYSIAALNGATTYTWTGPAGSRFSDGITTSTTATFTTSFHSVTVNFKTTPGLIKVKGNNACGSGPNNTLGVTFNCREAGPSYPESIFLTTVPNPTHDVCHVMFFLNKEDNYKLELTDITGRLLINSQGTSIAGDNEKQIDVSSLSKGTYLLKLQTGSATGVTRLVVD